MKNSQRGFVVPLLITIISLLVLGGGAYTYKEINKPKINDSQLFNEENIFNNKIAKDNSLPIVKEQERTNTKNPITSTSSEPCTRNGSMGTYKCKTDILNIIYPSKLKLKETSKNEITLSHSIPYKHTDFCDMKDGHLNIDFVDYSNKIKIVEEKYTSAIKKEYSFMADSLIDANGNFKLQEGFLDKMSINGVDVYKNFIGVEGCGKYIYIIPFNDKTLFVENYLNPPFSYEYPYKGPFTEQTIKEFRNLKGMILPEEAKIIFDKVLSDLITNIVSI